MRKSIPISQQWNICKDGVKEKGRMENGRDNEWKGLEQEQSWLRCQLVWPMLTAISMWDFLPDKTLQDPQFFALIPSTASCTARVLIIFFATLQTVSNSWWTQNSPHTCSTIGHCGKFSDVSIHCKRLWRWKDCTKVKYYCLKNTLGKCLI